MTPDISEFSYGFALTRELINIADPPLQAAPVFPSLIAEGSKGGGYDVHLDMPGFPLFIQFKRSEYMKTWRAREAKPPYNFPTPYYRMKITERWRSAQHEMLLELDSGQNLVFYAAPRFYEVEEFNKAYQAGTVSSQSCYVSPSKIGKLDEESHHVAFNAKRFCVCSEPRDIEGVEGEHLPAVLNARLHSESLRRFRDEPLNEALKTVEGILSRRNLTALTGQNPDAKAGEDQRLRRLADISLQYFGAQLFVVQRRAA